MPKSKRSLAFTLAVITFFVTAPVVTLYTAGYRYHWKKHAFERVGFFEVSSIPAGAAVALNGAIVGATPYVDTGILPGTYDIALTKPSYHSYATSVNVKSGLATLLENVLLFSIAHPEFVDTVPVTSVPSIGTQSVIRGSRLYTVETTAHGAALTVRSVGAAEAETTAALPAGKYEFIETPDRFIGTRETRTHRIDLFDARTLTDEKTLVADELFFEPSSRPERFVARTEFELTLYDLGADTSRLITRFSKPITAVAWHPTQSSLFVSVGGELLAISLDRNDPPLSLATFDSLSQIVVPKPGDVANLVGTRAEQTGVWRLKLRE